MTAASDSAEPPIPIVSLVAAIAAISVAGAGFGHSLPLFSVLLETYEASDFVIGSNTAFAAIAALLGAPFYPRLIARIGIRLFLLLSLAIMVLPYLLVFWAGERIWLWYPLRFIFSLGGAGLFAGSEIWINGLAPDRVRGKVIGIYATCLSLGFAGGPLILRVTGYEGFVPFLAGAAVFSLAAVPLLIARSPVVSKEDHGSIFTPMFRMPVIFGAAAMFAGVESAMLIFLPVLALELGHGVGVGAQGLTVYGIGLVAAQFPIGQLADRYPPRLVVAGCAAASALFAVTVPLVQQDIRLLYGALFAWGGALGGIYTAGLVVVGNRFKGTALAAANTGFVFAYAAGAVLGPFVAGTSRTLLGADGMVMVIAAVLAAYAWAARRPGRSDA